MVEHRCCASRNLRYNLVEEKAPIKIKIEIALGSHSQQQTLKCLEENGLMSSGVVGEGHTVLV